MKQVQTIIYKTCMQQLTLACKKDLKNSEKIWHYFYKHNKLEKVFSITEMCIRKL